MMARTRIVFLVALTGISALILGCYLGGTVSLASPPLNYDDAALNGLLSPPFAENPSCPVTLLLNCPSNAGLGHRVATALIGLDVALKTGSRLQLAKDYWSTGSHDTNYAWFDSGLLPLKRRKGAVAAATLPELDVATLLRGQGVQCGSTYRLHAGEQGNCGIGTFCLTVSPGALHRAVNVLHGARQQQQQHLHLPNPLLSSSRSSVDSIRSSTALPSSSSSSSSSSRPPVVEVLWHFRVGDAVLRVEPATIAKVKALIDSGFPKRGTKHVSVFDQHRVADLRRHFPTLESDDELGFELRTRGVGTEKDAFGMLQSAEVLVSTGSSFAIAAAAAAPTGKQVHFFFPPKEADMMYMCGPADDKPPYGCLDQNLKPKPESELRDLGAWQTYFMARNTLPLALDGQLFSGYAMKAARMMGNIDHGGSSSGGGGDSTGAGGRRSGGGGSGCGWLGSWMLSPSCREVDEATPFTHSEYYL